MNAADALRRRVAERAAYRCEYCLLHDLDAGFPHQIDHIISRKHGGLTIAENLAYACMVCNRYKGSDVASFDKRSGRLVRLFHPRQDFWADHFLLDRAFIHPVTGEGAATIQLLRFNAVERITERRFFQVLDSYPLKWL